MSQGETLRHRPQATDNPPSTQESTNRGAMRAHRSDGFPASVAGVLALTLSAVALAFALVGCSTNNNSTTPSTPGTAASSGAQLDVGNTINYGSFGTTTDIHCG